MLGILSFSTEVIFWVITAIALVLTVIFWHKFSTHNFRNVTARISIIIFIQVFAVASLGVTINRAGDFYDTWGDFFGTNKNLAKVAISPSTLSTITKVDVANADHLKDGGLVFKRVITGAFSGVSDYVYVAVSPSIAAQLETTTATPTIGTNYKVVELLPGYPGVPQTWIGTLQGIATMDRMEKAGQIPPTIAIIPAINVVRGLDTECLNIPGTSQVETWLSKDMKVFAQGFLGVDNRPWASFGYSTGGWCSAELSVRHPEQYNLAISLAGYFAPSFEAGINQRERNVLSQEYDIAKSVTAKPTTLKMLIIYSKRDKFSYASMNTFLGKVGNSLTTKLVEIPSGGHNIKVWKPFVQTGFQWLAQNG